MPGQWRMVGKSTILRTLVCTPTFIPMDINLSAHILAIGCGNLEDPENGRVTLTGTTINSKATYSCNDGFFLTGVRTRICQFNGEWSGKAPTCERMLV